MKLMCKNCRYYLDDDWGYCPKCGNKVVRVSRVFNNMFNDIFKMFIGPGQAQGRKIRVKITSRSPTGTRTVRKIESGPNPPKSDLKVIEPAASITKDAAYTSVNIQLPGIKKIEDVNFNKVGNSLEINAYTKDTRYFKIINLEKMDLIDRKFEKETLILRLK